jgi:endonuclease/exonuclease/phosphatase family metal-dependent hydrolase
MKTPEEENLNLASHPHQQIVESLKPFATFKEMRRSEEYRKHQRRLNSLFNKPRIYESPDATPRLQAFLRVVVWNIERGTQLEGLIEALNHHPVLRFADLLLLNELDDGMLRSGNINVAKELSRALSAHAIYGVEYLEFTKGTGDELNLPGHNTEALHGNAILTRHRFSNPQLLRLPRCENNFESAEKRIGGRLGIFVDLEIGDAKWLATTAHLDVVNTPRCRANQLREVLDGVERHFLENNVIPNEPLAGVINRRGEVEFVLTARSRPLWRRADLPTFSTAPVIVGGDFNTHTFARGGQFRTLKNTLKILGSNRERLARSLMKREPAVQELERFGYEVDALNDMLPTSSSLVSALNDKRSLPAPVRWWAMRRVGPEGLRLEFRLDWLAARGLRVLREGEVTDPFAKVASIKAQTIKDLAHNGKPLSDHDPIVADVVL